MIKFWKVKVGGEVCALLSPSSLILYYYYQRTYYGSSVDSDYTSVGKLLRLSASAATVPLLMLKRTVSDDDFL